MSDHPAPSSSDHASGRQVRELSKCASNACVACSVRRSITKSSLSRQPSGAGKFAQVGVRNGIAKAVGVRETAVRPPARSRVTTVKSYGVPCRAKCVCSTRLPVSIASATSRQGLVNTTDRPNPFATFSVLDSRWRVAVSWRPGSPLRERPLRLCHRRRQPIPPSDLR